jgi:hypothetical protein
MYGTALPYCWQGLSSQARINPKFAPFGKSDRDSSVVLTTVAVQTCHLLYAQSKNGLYSTADPQQETASRIDGWGRQAMPLSIRKLLRTERVMGTTASCSRQLLSSHHYFSAL